MKTRKWAQLIFAVVSLAACTEYVFSSQESVLQDDVQDFFSLIPDEQVMDKPIFGWQKFKQGDLSFFYPENWVVLIKEQDDWMPGYADLYLTVKNFAQPVLFGSGAQIFEDDSVISSGEEIVFQVDVYKNYLGFDWPSFFTEFFPGVIAKYEDFCLLEQPEADGRVITKIEGLFPGEEQVFFRYYDYFYGFSFLTAAGQEEKGRKLFYRFLELFNFCCEQPLSGGEDVETDY